MPAGEGCKRGARWTRGVLHPRLHAVSRFAAMRASPPGKRRCSISATDCPKAGTRSPVLRHVIAPAGPAVASSASLFPSCPDPSGSVRTVLVLGAMPADQIDRRRPRRMAQTPGHHLGTSRQRPALSHTRQRLLRVPAIAQPSDAELSFCSESSRSPAGRSRHVGCCASKRLAGIMAPGAASPRCPDETTPAAIPSNAPSETEERNRKP